ncbi:MAG TPA: hypothetical protein PKY50_14620 [Candidatus Competibacter sp.]|nr:hypothetical protein [Candidatus Competibacter sp.]
MKTTVELNESLFEEAKRYAVQHRITLRAVLESALHDYLKQQGTVTAPFRMRRATFAGHGLQAGIQEGDWNSIRSHLYEGQGG